MRVPSAKALLAAFPSLTAEDADLIRRLAREVDDRDKFEATIEAHCPATWAYARSCYNDPFDSHMWRRTMALHAIDNIVGTDGVEALGEADSHDGYAPPFEYLNMGDPYVTTLIYKRATDNLYIGCYGTVAEQL